MSTMQERYDKRVTHSLIKFVDDFGDEVVFKRITDGVIITKFMNPAYDGIHKLLSGNGIDENIGELETNKRYLEFIKELFSEYLVEPEINSEEDWDMFVASYGMAQMTEMLSKLQYTNEAVKTDVSVGEVIENVDDLAKFRNDE